MSSFFEAHFISLALPIPILLPYTRGKVVVLEMHYCSLFYLSIFFQTLQRLFDGNRVRVLAGERIGKNVGSTVVHMIYMYGGVEVRCICVYFFHWNLLIYVKEKNNWIIGFLYIYYQTQFD